MRNKLYKFIGIILIFLVMGCEKQLDDESNFYQEEQEIVNGFTVTWKYGLTTEQKNIIRSILDNMIYVKGGVFIMGGTQEQIPFARFNEYPAHLVSLSDFYINKYELNPMNVRILMGEPLSIVDGEESEQRKNKLFYEWKDWSNVIKLLNEMTGLSFDFPTEAQWEYAARGGNVSKGYVYPGSNNYQDIWNADFPETDDGRPMPNELGLFNMGNQLGEWCRDLYADYEDAHSSVDPCVDWGTDGHVVRGGNYEDKDIYEGYLSKYSTISYGIRKKDYRNCRVTSRYSWDHISADIGCRIVINKK